MLHINNTSDGFMVQRRDIKSVASGGWT